MKKNGTAAQIARITENENRLERCAAALARLREALDGYDAVQEDLAALEAYYTGPDWKRDFAADEKGRLPKDLKRGVLSEDGIGDVLDLNAALREELHAEAAAEPRQ